MVLIKIKKYRNKKVENCTINLNLISGYKSTFTQSTSINLWLFLLKNATYLIAVLTLDI